MHIESPPQTKTATVGNFVTFQCVFNQRVQCIWYRNGAAIKISRRYTYLDAAAHTKSNNCSINIDNVQLVDFGNWRCSSAVDSSSLNPPSLNNFLRSGTLGFNINNIECLIQYDNNDMTYGCCFCFRYRTPFKC